jgi:hypothetical protein
MFPDDVPDAVIRYWEAVERWYASGTHKEPTREELVKKFQPAISTRTLDRIRHDHGALVGRWPPRRLDRPPWLLPSPDGLPGTQELNVVQDQIHRLRRIRTPAFDEQGNPVTVDLFYDTETGRLVESILGNIHGLAALVAGLFIFDVLDLVSDGKLDGVIRMFHFIGCHATIG